MDPAKSTIKYTDFNILILNLLFLVLLINIIGNRAKININTINGNVSLKYCSITDRSAPPKPVFI